MFSITSRIFSIFHVVGGVIDQLGFSAVNVPSLLLRHNTINDTPLGQKIVSYFIRFKFLISLFKNRLSYNCTGRIRQTGCMNHITVAI